MQGLAGRREWVKFCDKISSIKPMFIYILIVLFYGVWFRTKERGINLTGYLEGMILLHLNQIEKPSYTFNSRLSLNGF